MVSLHPFQNLNGKLCRSIIYLNMVLVAKKQQIAIRPALLISLYGIISWSAWLGSLDMSYFSDIQSIMLDQYILTTGK